MFETHHCHRLAASASDIWAVWSDPGRWGDWNDQFDRAEAADGLELGADVRVKYRKGGNVVFAVTALEPERVLTLEARFPGARLGHEHRIDAEGSGSGVDAAHRIYVSGPLSGFWALMLGRKRLRESVADFAERERDLVSH
jgi:hypothetical protein